MATMNKSEPASSQDNKLSQNGGPKQSPNGVNSQSLSRTNSANSNGTHGAPSRSGDKDSSKLKTGYSSTPSQGKLGRGYSDKSLSGSDSGSPSGRPGLVSQKSSGGSSRSQKNFNLDGTPAREFNRDGSMRSIGSNKEPKETQPKVNSPSGKTEVVSISDVDRIIKQASSKKLIATAEIDAFISDIEKNLSAKNDDIKSTTSSGTLSRTSSRRTVKNASLKAILLDENSDFDRYGFLIMKPEPQSYRLSSNEFKKSLDKEDERTDKWIYMLNHWDTFFLRKFDKVKSRVRKGIPHAVRGEVWYRLAHVDDMKNLFPHALDLDDLESRLNEHVVDEIGRDVNRTFPSHKQFQEGGPGQEALRRVLQRYAILDPAIGYCQGMGFLTALLLQYLHEHDAFYALVSLMNRPSLPFRGMYSPGMEDTKKSLAVFAILAEVKVPKLWIHMQNQGIHHSMFVTSWIMTVFVSSFHFDFAVRVWDILWVEGWKTVYRVCIGLLKYAEAELLTCNMEDIMMYFRKLPDRMNPEEVWKVVWKVKLSQAEVTRCEQWYYEESGAA